MAQDQNALVWLDMEMTGLLPDSDRIIEVALVVTNSNLDIVAEAPVWVVHQPDEVLDRMDEWNRGTHGKSGLTARVKSSILSEAQVEEQALEFLRRHVPKATTPMCASAITRAPTRDSLPQALHGGCATTGHPPGHVLASRSMSYTSQPGVVL